MNLVKPNRDRHAERATATPSVRLPRARKCPSRLLPAGVYLLDPRCPLLARLVTTVAVVAAAFGLSAYFYLPLALSKRSQSAFTDSEVSLSWHMLFSHGPNSLDGLTPVLLVLCLLLVG